MTTHVRVSPYLSMMADRGTIHVCWPDGTTTTEAEDEVSSLLEACRRSRPLDDLTAQHGTVLVDRLLRSGLLVPWVDGDLVRIHHSTLGVDTVPSPGFGPDEDPRASDDSRLMREYGAGHTLDLPRPASVHADLDQLLARRSSARTFDGNPLSLAQLSTLFATALNTGPGAAVRPRVPGAPPARTAYPSAGALYPVELALIAWHGEDLEPAAYRYQPLSHRLYRHGDVTASDATHLAGETAQGAAALLVLWCDLFSPTFAKYGAKGYRLMLLEAGHIMQNLVLVAEALSLPALPVSGIRDTEVAQTLGLAQPEQVPVYGLLLGGM